MPLAIPISIVGSDLWNADAYGALSITYRVSDAIRKYSTELDVADGIWELDRLLRQILENIYAGAENPPVNSKPVLPESLASAIETLRKIYTETESIYSDLQSIGLFNGALISPAINSLRTRADDILDLAESLELSLDPDIDESFARTLGEYHRGETIDLENIR